MGNVKIDPSVTGAAVDPSRTSVTLQAVPIRTTSYWLAPGQIMMIHKEVVKTVTYFLTPGQAWTVPKEAST